MTLDDLQRNEKAPLLEIWTDGNVPPNVIEDVRIQSWIWRKLGRPGPLPRENVTMIIAKYFQWDEEEKKPVNKKSSHVTLRTSLSKSA